MAVVSKDDKHYMLKINEEQKQYYEFDVAAEFEFGGNKATKFWDKIRDYQYQLTDFINLNEKLFETHKDWAGNLTDKKVLDLGCHNGNELSHYFAENSQDYTALDLSASALSVLRKSFDENNLLNAKTVAVDFLSDEFSEKNFDLVYAKAIFHHFKYLEVFLQKLHSVLKPGGFVITVDPLNTYLPLRIVRSLYRPFQKDKEWEYPFTKESIALISKYFDVVESVGMMGKLKYAIPLYLISPEKAKAKSIKWMQEDSKNTDFNNKDIWKCLRISMMLRAKKLD